nr:NTP transferase domain-containing protein [Solitalea agri]
MKTDKFSISYHDNTPQWLYLFNLLRPLVENTFLSCRKDQISLFEEHYPIIIDGIDGDGPSVGLISAHLKHPDAAWLVIACDLPLLTDKTLRELISSRNIHKSATSFISPINNLPEPLIAIWEPRALHLLKENFEAGLNCPRKTLLNTTIELLTSSSPLEQMNANTPEDRDDALKILG